MKYIFEKLRTCYIYLFDSIFKLIKLIANKVWGRIFVYLNLGQAEVFKNLYPHLQNWNHFWSFWFLFLWTIQWKSSFLFLSLIFGTRPFSLIYLCNSLKRFIISVCWIGFWLMLLMQKKEFKYIFVSNQYVRNTVLTPKKDNHRILCLLDTVAEHKSRCKSMSEKISSKDNPFRGKL